MRMKKNEEIEIVDSRGRLRNTFTKSRKEKNYKGAWRNHSNDEEKRFLVLCRVNLILDKSGFKVLGKAFLSDFWFWFLVFWFWHFLSLWVSPFFFHVFIFGFSFYHPVTLVRCPSFVPFAATRFLFCCYSFIKFFFWFSTLPSNSSIRVGLSHSERNKCTFLK